jgi:hypothetical protein
VVALIVVYRADVPLRKQSMLFGVLDVSWFMLSELGISQATYLRVGKFYLCTVFNRGLNQGLKRVGQNPKNPATVTKLGKTLFIYLKIIKSTLHTKCNTNSTMKDNQTRITQIAVQIANLYASRPES